MVVSSKPKDFDNNSEAVVSYVNRYSYENKTDDYATALIKSPEIYPQVTSYNVEGPEFSDWDFRAAIADALGEPRPIWKKSTSKSVYDLAMQMKSAAAIAKKEFTS